MSWQMVILAAIGAGTAIAGAYLTTMELVALGSTIVGGAIGVAVPRRAHHDGQR